MSVGYDTLLLSRKKEPLMAIIVANENGDWWSVESDMLTNLYILDTDKLSADQLESIEVKWGLEPDEDFFVIDKVERIIWEYGTKVVVNVGGIK
jgi:hypothetical protein